MNIDRKVERLRANVEVAFDEFVLVMKLYETWRPAAFDQDLFDRVGHSYAAHAFLLIREALSREIVLGLTKLWDTADRAIRMERIGEFIRTPAVIRALAGKRSVRFRGAGIPGVAKVIECELNARAQAALAIIDSYLPQGPSP